jgi:ACS family D-galactonate transporter-like MFS transporter
MSNLPPPAPAHSPTHVRWLILLLLMAFAGLVHFNRISISVAGTEHIMRDYSLSETRMGMVYSSYLFIYTLFMMPGGWLIDYIGPKRALLFLGLGSAVLVPLTGLTGLAGSGGILVALCIVRALLGVVSTPMHPGAARAISFWMPYHARGASNGLVTGAAVSGIAATYFVFGFLMDQVGWQYAFLIAGGVTLLLTIAWWLTGADRPADHPGVNQAERDLIEEGDLARMAQESMELKSAPTAAVPPPPGRDRDDFTGLAGVLSMLGYRSLLLLTASYAMASYFQYLFFYWVQYYFDHVLELSTRDGRIYSTIVLVSMAVGMLVGGWLTDLADKRIGGRRGRALVPVCGLIGSAVLLVLGIVTTHTATIVTCFALAMGALGACEPAFWTTGVELGRRHGGLSAAFLNTGGNAGGILAPIITPLFSAFFGWRAGLCVAAVLCLLGAVMWIGIDPRQRR